MSNAGFVEIAFIQRTHGIKGELQLNWLTNSELNPSELESVFIEIDGIPVPFFIEEVKSFSGEKVIIKFDEVDTIEQATNLVSHPVLIPLNQMPDEELGLEDLVGYKVCDSANKQLGTITAYEDFGYNAIFTIKLPTNKEILIPATDAFIVEYDEKHKTIKMQFPEGLLNDLLEL